MEEIFRVNYPILARIQTYVLEGKMCSLDVTSILVMGLYLHRNILNRFSLIRLEMLHVLIYFTGRIPIF